MQDPNVALSSRAGLPIPGHVDDRADDGMTVSMNLPVKPNNQIMTLLNNMKVDKQIMPLFYRSIVESVMSYCIISWFGSSHKKDHHKLAKIGRIAKRMGVNSKSLMNFTRMIVLPWLTKSLKIRSTLYTIVMYFYFLRTGRRLNANRNSNCLIYIAV